MSVAPRINSAMISQYVGKPVRIVGTVQGYDDSKQVMTLLASDGSQNHSRQTAAQTLRKRAEEREGLLVRCNQTIGRRTCILSPLERSPFFSALTL